MTEVNVLLCLFWAMMRYAILSVMIRSARKMIIRKSPVLSDSLEGFERRTDALRSHWPLLFLTFTEKTKKK